MRILSGRILFVSPRYTPHPDYKGPFHVFNEASEEALLRRFYSLIEVPKSPRFHPQEEKPNIFVTFNGDFFDWGFIRDRSAVYGIDLARETGFREVNGEFRGRSAGSVSQIMSKSAPGRVRVGEARLVPSPRIPRIEGGDAGEGGV